jgi:DNA-binding NarL/FixJ family response regulator
MQEEFAPQSPRGVLIVDNDDGVRDAIRPLLEASDVLVVGEATNGIEASYMAYRHQPAIVVLDYLMPRMNGAETSYVVRYLSPRSKILAFSSFLGARPSWADAYLSKDNVGQIVPVLETLTFSVYADGRGGGRSVD